MITVEEAAEFERTILKGGVVLFPTDTVYGLACSPDNQTAINRMYALKGRSSEKAAAVMFFNRESALRVLPDLSSRMRAVLCSLLPGSVTILLTNSTGVFPLASAGASSLLGVRVPLLRSDFEALSRINVAVLQTSANFAGGPNARRLDQVPVEIRQQVDLVLDGGELNGEPSTVVDLSDLEQNGTWKIVRSGALDRAEVARVIKSTYDV